MKCIFRLVVVGTLWLALPASAQGQRLHLSDRISLDTEAAQAASTLKSLAQLVGARLEIDPEVAERTVSLRVHNVRLSLVLDTLCDSIGCRWQHEENETGGQTLIRVSDASTPVSRALGSAEDRLDENISLDLKDASFDELMRSFARMLGAKLELDPELADGEVTLSLRETPLRVALDTVVGQPPYHWQLVTENGQRRLKVWKE